MKEEQNRFIDAETFQGSGSDKITFRMIILFHLQRLLTLATKEMGVGGRWEKSVKIINGVAFPQEKYIEDSREIFCEGVKVLSNVLAPYYKGGIEEKEKTFQEGLDEIVSCCNEGKISMRQFKGKKFILYSNFFRDLNYFLKDIRYLEAKELSEG